MKFSKGFLLPSLLISLVVLGVSASSGYEVWAVDQSNSALGQSALGVKGGYLYIYDSDDIETQVAGGADATPLPCGPGETQGPCNILDVFPQSLVEYDANGNPTGNLLSGLDGFGRLHGANPDPEGRYVNANLFTPGGGYVGVIDVQTKQAVGLFRVSKMSYLSPANTFVSTRSVHMSFWTADGGAIIVANLNGKAMERINVDRDASGTITGLHFDRSATLGLGKTMSVAEEATVFLGPNAHGVNLIGDIVGSYSNADLSDLTPNGVCKELGCNGPAAAMGGRGNNVPICPIPSANGYVYITMGGGGLLVADSSETPMAIVGEYGRNVMFGAGCAGAQSGDKMFLNAGVSASGAGHDQSMYAVWAFDDTAYGTAQLENTPMPDLVFDDPGNTASLGNTKGDAADNSGQLPGITTRRDSHGAAPTVDGAYIHVVDRIQNNVEVFDATTYQRFTYDLTSFSGQSGLNGREGACMDASVTDDPGLPLNDPAPDLFFQTPDGKYMMIAFRGPAPVTVNHSAQGSCPGVGVVELLPNGQRGRLVAVLRASNPMDDGLTVSAAGGHPYSGIERADVHGCVVVPKFE